ncbi:contractile injection system protein, VgrG/Pvc8 family [Legionella impletisoli]|uniref:Uncharacterized protein n=1 Tax=Legionella impletisoli TaxID=343510 RepID=A0A917JRV3_9GAMM|nr:contractile injection system protein, VgrG/Pvc8 family [Legionella impletisoli]GGI83742.1 hypothetical protein GCM10007966_10430 [Legionella impletisoli]
MKPTAGAGLSASLKIGSYRHSILSFSGKEAMNEPYSFKLRLESNTLLTAEAVLGQGCQLELAYQKLDPSETDWPTFRIIPGIITKHLVLNPYQDSFLVEIEIRARLYLLTLSGCPRVYLDQTAKDIATLILLQHGYQASLLQFHDNNQKNHLRIYPHWVQAEGESDLAFLERVLAREGISYAWSNVQTEQEQLDFYDCWYLHPGSSSCFTLAETDGLTSLRMDALYHLRLCQTPTSVRVEYRDVDYQNPDKILKAKAGTGHHRVNVLGYGAESLDHLQEAALHHLERITMNETTFTAKTLNPAILCGQVFSIKHLPNWIKENAFLLLSVEHTFEEGFYSNQLTFIPKHTQIRPNVKRQNAGQIIHTAVIHSEDDAPGLDSIGQYHYYTHVHEANTPTKPIQKALRLVPYGGKGATHPIGMHFPLQRQAEVLVMYLHNDFNQPILQNSPSNGLNHAPVTSDNAWSTIIKTAWGQYLEFVDQIGQERITLANAARRNRLSFNTQRDKQHILLACDRGSISLEAKTQQTIQSQEMTATIGKELVIQTNQKAHFTANDIHLQAESYQLSCQTLSFESKRHLELSGQTMQLMSEGDITLNASGDRFQFNLPNGDLVLEADEIALKARGALYLTTPTAGITLSNAGIIMHGNGIQFSGTPVFNAPIADTSTQVPPLITPPLPNPPILKPVRQFTFQKAKVIYPPNWEKPFYQSDETAYIEVDVKGFTGDESIKATIVSYHHSDSLKPLPLNPKLVAIKSKEVDTIQYSLGDKALYPFEEQFRETPGTATLKIPYPLNNLLAQSQTKASKPYYVRIDVGDVQGQFYSNALVLLNQATLTIIHDKKRPYHEKHAILTVFRSLPGCVKAHPQCPLLGESRFYTDPTEVDRLPIGTQNSVKLKEKGRYQELLSQDFTMPLPEQRFEVSERSNADTTLVRLMPPMIIDLRDATLQGNEVVFHSESPNARVDLTEEEINYIKANGNNLTVFIHGYNVEFGRFSKHLEAIREQTKITSLPLNFMVAPEQVIDYSEVDATIYRDEAFIKRQFQDDESQHTLPFVQEPSFNGEGVCEWVVHFENNLNRAAGFDGVDYQKFTRCLFIIWPGNPDSPMDYIHAVYESARMGPIVAKVFKSLKTHIEGLKLHVIAHSQGNGVLLHALEHLGETGHPGVDHAIFWQAAIPNDALSDRGVGNAPPNREAIAKAQEKNLWYCPYAHQGASLITVLHSQNDNILGPLLRQEEQPKGISLKEVWGRKPKKELQFALLIEALGLKSLYLVAIWLDTPVSSLFDQQLIHHYWNRWRAKNPQFKVRPEGPWMMCAATLEEQYQLLKLHQADVLSHAYRKLVKEGITKVHALLKERFGSLSVLERSGYVLISGLDAYKPLYNALFELVNRYDKQLDTEPSFLDRITRCLETHHEPFKHLFTLFQTSVLLTGVGTKPALGYEGPDFADKFIDQLKQNKKLKHQDTTKWLWHHSDMKIPSNKVIKNIYKKWIINSKKGIQAFGTY